MATWDSADLLSQFNELAKRPTTDEITDATKYTRLARAQMDVIYEVAIRYPNALYQSPTAMSTSDSNVFTFGTDANGHAVAPYGHVAIFTSTTAVPDRPWVEGEHGDYLDEGTQIRLPHGRVYGGTLYWRGIATPADIAAATQPSLRPAPARRLIAIKAAWNFALEGGARPGVEDAMERMWARQFPIHMAVWRTRFRHGGALDTRLIRTDPWGGATGALGR